MSGSAVAVATCRAAPDLDADGPTLLAALAGTGLRADVRIWDDPAVDWSAYEVVLIRSTWDYPRRRAEFLGWVGRCRRTSNPAAVLAWNTDKHHLLDLRRAGVPVVPTVFPAAGDPFAVPESWRGGDVVVKPTVSASAADTGRFAAADPDARALAARIHGQGRAVMVQPYLDRVDDAGETALVFLGGEFSHAVRKAALLTGTGTRAPLVGDDALAAITPAVPDPAQLAVARTALDAVPGGPEQLSYARVDLVPGPDGAPLLLELELTEPSLFLQHAPAGAVSRLARAVAAAARP